MPSFNTILGIDLSLTNTGLAVIGHDGARWVTHRTVSSGKQVAAFKDPERQFRILTLVINIVKQYRPDAVVIEDYAMGRAVGKAFTRAELGGMVKKFLLVEFGVPVFLVSPAALKRFMDCADKKKRGDKDAMFEAAVRRFNFISTDNDIVDAYCLARYLVANRDGQRLTIVRHDPLPQYRARAVQTPAPKKLSSDDKNRLLTTSKPRPTFRAVLRRIRLP